MIRCKNLVRRSDVGAEERASVYAFLLGALRRPGRSSAESPRRRSPRRSPRSALSLRVLPQDVIQHIARLSHEPRYVAEFALEPDESYAFEFGTALPRLTQLDCKISELAVTCLEFGGDLPWLGSIMLKQPILRSRVYVELSLSSVWYGTTVSCRFLSNQPGGLILWFSNDDDTSKETVQLVMHGTHYDVPALADSWTWVDEPLLVRILVDTLHGCVTFCLNDVAGLCVRLGEPQSKWERTPMIIKCEDFPSADDERMMQTAVSSPPCPPFVLCTAAYPKSASELIDSGSLVSTGQTAAEVSGGHYPAAEWET